MNLKILKSLLKNFYSDGGNEKIGFILPNNDIVEVINISESPENSFLVDALDIIKYTEEKNAIATWHTHPNQSSNLSGEDYRIFHNWPNLNHFIIGNDGVRCFSYDKKLKDIVEIE